LPEAHVEAPTSGSILLAGILLKLGTYGFIRFLITLFPYANCFFTPLVIVICLFGVIYGSFGTIRQVDLKKIIAYSSVVHMNFAIIGLFSKNLEGIQGSFFLMISHGIISGALFLCIGVLYDRYHTRILYYYGGLVNVMPIFSVIFLVFILSNMGFPGTSGFVGEILVLISFFSFNYKVSLILATSMVFSAVYSLWLYNRVIFGEIKNFFILDKSVSIGFFKK
jgi:NADH-quinone oxidoreductase subunit M